MIGGNVFQAFAPPPPFFPLPALENAVFAWRALILPCSRWRSNLLYLPECSFHGWLKMVLFIASRVLYPFQMMSGFMSWGSWIVFMSNIQGVPGPRRYTAGKVPHVLGPRASPWRSLEAHPQVPHWVWIWEEAELSRFGEMSLHSSLAFHSTDTELVQASTASNPLLIPWPSTSAHMLTVVAIVSQSFKTIQFLPHLTKFPLLQHRCPPVSTLLMCMLSLFSHVWFFATPWIVAWASLVVSGKESACNAGVTGDAGLIPGLGRSPGGGNGNLCQYYCMENPMDRGAWWATVRGILKQSDRT